MFFDEETKYWQEEFKKGNLDDMDMSGEELALLDGTVERDFMEGIRWIIVVIPTILSMMIFAFLQSRCPDFYACMQNTLRYSWVTFYQNVDPAGMIVGYVVIISTIVRCLLQPKRKK